MNPSPTDPHSPTACRLVAKVPAYLDGGLGPEEEAEIRRHLCSCGICLAAFCQHAAHGLLAAQMGRRTSLQAAPWATLRGLAQDKVDWAQERLRWITTKLETSLEGWLGPSGWAMSLATPPTRGGLQVRGGGPIGGGWREKVAIASTDPSGRRTVGKLLFQVRKPPSIARTGHFSLDLSTTNRALAGRWLLCTVKLSGEKVTFEGELLPEKSGGGCRVRIREQVLPAQRGRGRQSVVIPRRDVTSFRLVPGT